MKKPLKSLGPHFISTLCWSVTVCLSLFGDAFAVSAGPKCVELREAIFSYVGTNEEQLRSQLEEIKQWKERYYWLGHLDDQLIGFGVEWPYSKEIISEIEIVDYFNENEFIGAISYPVNSDIVVFYVGGFGIVTSDIEMGFYYSPDDNPKWINSEQLRPFGLETGQYLSFPMIPEGDGWVPDMNLITSDNDPESLLDSYLLYTERICENFFYYESSY